MKILVKLCIFILLTLSTQGCGRTDLSGKPAEGEVNKLALLKCKFNQVDIQSSSTITAYLNSATPFGSICSSEQRGCNNGELGGSYQYATCFTEAAASCLFHGVTIAHGNTVVAFLESSVASGLECTQEIRSCDNGTLNGSYTFQSCSSL